MMKPDIFMDDFERTAWGDAHYGAVGRALTFATRFEAACKSLNILLGLKKEGDVLKSESALQAFVARLHKKLLAQHISSIAKGRNDLAEILGKARLARNDIAHDVTLGLDRPLDSLPESSMQALLERLDRDVTALAEADRAVSFIVSHLTKEPVPASHFLRDYPEKVRAWVTELSDYF